MKVNFEVFKSTNKPEDKTEEKKTNTEQKEENIFPDKSKETTKDAGKLNGNDELINLLPSNEIFIILNSDPAK